MSFEQLRFTERPDKFPFACYAVLVVEDHFAYLYGSAEACARALAMLPDTDYLLRQGHSTLDHACAGCESAASAVHGSRGGRVVAQAVKPEDFHALHHRWRHRGGESKPSGEA